MSVIRNNPDLWEIAKAYVMRDGERWDARKAQQAVLYYKNVLGGTYSGKKPTAKQNNLVKWTKEDWQYIDSKNKGRYLPKKVIQQMPKSLKAKENKIKQKDKTPNAPYSDALVKLMKINKII